jgi:hypothetical protein
MKQQRWYIIDRLHKRVNGAVHCPGCLLHKPSLSSSVNGSGDNGYDGQVDDTTVFSEGKSGRLHACLTNNIRRRARG